MTINETALVHWGTDPGHGGLAQHTGVRRDCAGPDCGPLEGECMCGDDLDANGDCPRCAHGIGLDVEYADCGRCGAVLNSSSPLCWYCDRSWIWSDP